MKRLTKGRFISFLTALIVSANSWGVALTIGDYGKDVDSIKKMTGCYKVTFQNAETFSLSEGYDYHDRFKSGPVLEWIFVDSEKRGKVSLQHLRLAGPSIIKHWRQEWVYEENSLFDYMGNDTWKPIMLDDDKSLGMWTQKVYQVDDSPRYECSAPWIRYAGKNFWECTANAPLPRREFKKRSDYDILKRTNRHEMIASGHIHDQDNIKIQKRGGMTKALVMEKGLNTYERVPSSKCQKAVDWWQEHKGYWFNVRKVWDEVFGRQETLSFKKKVDGQKLWQKLFQLDETYAGSREARSIRVRNEIRDTISDYLK